MEKSDYGRDGIYRSLRPKILFLKDPNHSMITFLLRNISSYPRKLDLIDADSNQTLNFAEFKSTLSKVSIGLHKLGVRKNDIVLIFTPKSIQFPLCFFGIIALRAIATTVNPAYIVAEISKQVKDCKPKMVIAVRDLWEKVKGFGLPGVILGFEGLIEGTNCPICSDSHVNRR